ncbi:hypothetical protein [Vibrio hippocampi]|uniref:DNA gyrase subunit B n=1 Tax=Vibrio hippocampi TaxID=654686 RepID=A0ABM8ZMY9_9VIBR|nr:hypothetical protein [Vibrio hippocampi]CAH0529179.1 hypothetical protein VHP8226_03090 [Vibrio hippocampi]
MRKLLTALSALVLAVYPFVIYLGIEQYGLNIIGGVLIGALLLRLIFARQSKVAQLKYFAGVSAIIGVSLVALDLLLKQYRLMLFYPVVVNACMLMVFAASLWQKQSIIERLARLQQPDLAPSGVRYTRKVTQVWCLFFIVNGAIAFYSCFQSLEVWTLYNGLIGYLGAGTLFVVEWLIRQVVQKKHQACDDKQKAR